MECLHAHIPSYSPTPSHMPNPESIPTPITQLKVFMITMIVCLLWATELFCSCRGSLHPYRTFRITPHVSYTHVPGFSPEGVNSPLLAPLNTHYLYFFYFLNRETFIGHHPKYELTTHSSTLMMDDHTHAHTPNMLMSLCICNTNMPFHAMSCYMHNKNYKQYL